MSTRTEELQAAGRLAGEALAAQIGIARGMHDAITQRVARKLPPGGREIALLQGAIADAVYGAVAGVKRSGPAAAGQVLAITGGADGPKLSDTTVGRIAIPAVNGIWGDTVAAREPALAVQMAVRVGGKDLPMQGRSVPDAFPDATGRLVIFVHGLGESDRSWQRSSATSVPYGVRLRDEHGYTPIYIRYNSGLRISDNGLALARLITDLTREWPVPLERVVLVGHSMGGLVARSACHYAEKGAEPWVEHVDTVVSLGAPHLGAPLEKGVHVFEWILNQFPETAAMGRLFRVRSVGVKDLRYGHVVEDDWFGHDPDELLTDRSTEVPFLSHATYYFVAASIARDIQHPAGRLLGDGLVRYPSASGSGRARKIGFEIDNGVHLGGVGHLALLNHPKVYQQLERWLARRAITAGPAAAVVG